MTRGERLRRYWWVPLLAIAIIAFFRLTQTAKPKLPVRPQVAGESIGE